jgi:hypothetical protein
MRAAVVVALILLAGAAGHAVHVCEAAQSAAFEVASVKRSAPDAQGMLISGPTPSGFRTLNAPLSNVIRYAFEIADYQLVDAPAWVRSERFDISAKYPPRRRPESRPGNGHPRRRPHD